MYSYNHNQYGAYHFDPYRQMISKAYAEISGSELAPNLRGYVVFTDVPNGTNVTVEVTGLPEYKRGQGDQPPIGPHGFHIHENATCGTGDKPDPFEKAGGHWNPYNQLHGNHPGDFPVLFSNDGYSYMSFFTNRFTVEDVVGKTVMIHQNPDDYRSQPSGNAGKRLGCGEIKAW